MSVVSAATTVTVPTAPNNGWGFIWNGVSGSQAGGTNTEVYQAAINSGTNPIQKLVFQFKNNSVEGSGDATTYTATTNDTDITLKGNSKAIQMGDGNGTLKIDFNRATTADSNKFTLDLSSTTNLAYSFVGNIETSYGSDKQYSPNSYFKAIFGASVKGNITLNGGGKATGQYGNPYALTFENGAKLEGNLNVEYDDAGVKFAGGNSGSAGAITGSLNKTGSGQLFVDFDSINGGLIGSGGETVVKSTGGVGSITVSNLKTLNVKSVSARDSINTLSFLEDASIIISDGIYADAFSQNILKADKLANFSVGKIKSFGGTNNIIFKNSSENLSLNSTIEAQANGGLNSKNALALTGMVVSYGNDNARVDMTIGLNTTGNNAWDTTAANYVLLNGTTSQSVYLDEMNVGASSGNNGINAKRSLNVLSFNNASGTNNLKINSMTASQGANVIGKNYLTTDASENATVNITLQSDSSTLADTSLFDKDGGFILANFMKQDNSAAFNTLEIGTVTANSGGSNFINTLGNANINTISASNGNNYINAGLITFGNISASNRSNQTGTSTLGSVSAYAGKNIIAITGSSSTNAFQTADSNGAITLTAKASGVAVGQNILNFTGSGTTLTLTSMTLDNDNANNYAYQSAANYINLAGTTNNITIGSMDAGSRNNRNLNVLAKGIFEGSSVADFTYKTGMTTDTYMADTQAFEGTLKITDGIFGAKGTNIISYKATASATSTIISGDAINNNAISGNATVYLNASASGIAGGVSAISDYLTNLASMPNNQETLYTTLAEKAVIAGDIVGSESTNIKIVGKANVSASAGIASKTITNNNQIAILGNITTSSGATTNIVMQDAFFAPSEMIIADLSNGSSTKTVSVGGENAGNITTSGGTTNIITRFSVDPLSSGTSIYNVKNTRGVTNVVLQGKLDIGTHLDYTKNSAINLIFANNNNGTDSFEASQTELTGNGSKILGVTYQDGVKLAIADKTVMIGDNPSASFLETYSSYYTNGSTALATVLANRTDDKDTISIHGLIVGNIYSLATSTASGVGTGGYAVNGKTYDVTLEKGAAFAGSINLDASTTSAINIVMNEGSKLILADASDNASANNFVISTLNITGGSVDTYQLQTETLKQSNTVINIATGGASANNVATRENFRLLTIGNANTSNGQSNAKAETGLQGEGAAVFMTYVNTNANQENATLGGVSSSGKTSAVVSRSRGGAEGQYGNLYSDRIIIANIGDNTKAQNGTYYMQFAVDANSKLGSVTYNASNDNGSNSSGGVKTAGNIAVLTVVNTGSNGSKQAGITLKTQDVLQGFDQIGGDLVAIQTDINGVYNENGAYTTYFINNLTTRGATQATQEATASAFATNYDLYMANFNSLNKRMGELRENNHSQGVWARVFTGSQTNDFSKSKSTYTTVQGGYDYAIGMEGANNYIGLAVAYAMSSSKSNLNALDITGTIKNIENIKSNAVEVAVYNSYVQDEGWYNDTIAKFSYIFSDFNITGQESTYSTNNMAFTLSDEFGYRFKLGSEKEWMIDPQLEVAFGYFNQSDFIQTLGLSSLEGVAEGIFTTRARLGSSFGYDFKKFTQGKGIKASVYVGAFYEYDYVTGGDIKLTTNLGGETTSSSAISSDGRVVMNVGTNVEIYDNTRIYFDFESSFAGKIRTDYQVNIGARYSFGESNGYTPAVAKAKEVAPLKVEEVKNTQENQAQESKTTQESK